jgi:hypothetical protein
LSGNDDESYGTTRQLSNNGPASLYDKAFRLTERAHEVPKRAKSHLEETTEKLKPKTHFAGGSGVLGPLNNEGNPQKTVQAINSAIDLTQDDDDDDDVILVMDMGDKEVCYGMLRCQANIHTVPHPPINAVNNFPNDWPVIRLRLLRVSNPKSSLVELIDPLGNKVGSIDVMAASGVAHLLDKQIIRADPRLMMRKKLPDENVGDRTSLHLSLLLILYGKRKQAKYVGDVLKYYKAQLLYPTVVEKGLEIVNPHKDLKIQKATSIQPTVASYNVQKTIEEIRDDVLGLFDTLQQTNYAEMEPDPRIKTSLLPHQKQALSFMSDKERDRVISLNEKENSSLWGIKIVNGRNVFINRVSASVETQAPPQVYGGILADMMGLGKTLSILSLIVGSLNDSVDFAAGDLWEDPGETEDKRHEVKYNTKGTLLICPLSTMYNWEEQIRLHVQPGTLNYYVHHGPGRTADPKELLKYDLVVTTYSIVANEFDRTGRGSLASKSPLHQVAWFRVALDEAHMIREQRTKQFKAVYDLTAQRRWAITGTPVQNKLDDLGALLRFIRLRPFDSRTGFTQYILAPFKAADPDILPKLRVLVDSITLRRLKDRISLPKRVDRLERLEFSGEEQELYDWFAKDAVAKVKAVAPSDREKLAQRAYVHILKTILRLRMISAHGKELLRPEDLKMMEGSNSSTAIDISEDNENTKPLANVRQAYEAFVLMRDAMTNQCASCQKQIAPTIDSDDESKSSSVFGYILPCFDMFCLDCHGALTQTINLQNNEDNHMTCPVCKSWVKHSIINLNLNELRKFEDESTVDRSKKKSVEHYSGPHTKTKALLQSLKESEFESELLPDEPPIKRFGLPNSI